MKKTNLHQVGTTEDGKKVYAGVYTFFSCYGLPLDVIFGIAKEQGWVPCWISFYKEAKLAGMSHDRVISKLEEALCDTFGLDYSNIVIDKLNSVIGKDG